MNRSISLLRQMQDILRSELSDINLRALLADTESHNIDINRGGLVLRWERVLETMAVQMTDFSRKHGLTVKSIESAKKQVDGSMSILLLSMTLVWVIMIAFVFESDKPNASRVFIIIVFGIISWCVARMFMIVFENSYRRYKALIDSPVNQRLSVIADRMNVKPVQLAAAVITGKRDVQKELCIKDIDEDDDSITEEERQRLEKECSKQKSSVKQIVEDEIVQSRIALVYLAKELVFIRYDLDHIDRIALWKCATSGVDRLRILISNTAASYHIEDDAEGIGSGLDKHRVIAVLRQEVVPLLRTRGVQLPTDVRLTTSMTTSHGSNMNTFQGLTKSGCWSKCLVDGRCGVAQYTAVDGVCKLFTKDSPVELSKHDAQGSHSPTYTLLANPFARVNQGAGVIETGAQLIADPVRIATTLREQADTISASILDVLERHGFRISIAKNRQFIHSELQEIHGLSAYSIIRPTVDMIIDRTQTGVSDRIRDKQPFVSTDEFLRRVLILSSTERAVLTEDLHNLKRCSDRFVRNFPPNETSYVRDSVFAVIRSIYMICMILLVYFVYNTVKNNVEGTTNVFESIFRIMVACSVFAIVVMTWDISVQRSVDRRDHNADVSWTNTTQLMLASKQASISLEELFNNIANQHIDTRRSFVDSIDEDYEDAVKYIGSAANAQRLDTIRSACANHIGNNKIQDRNQCVNAAVDGQLSLEISASHAFDVKLDELKNKHGSNFSPADENINKELDYLASNESDLRKKYILNECFVRLKNDNNFTCAKLVQEKKTGEKFNIEAALNKLLIEKRGQVKQSFKDTEKRALAASTLVHLKAVVVAMDRCNDISKTVPAVPFPVSELLTFAIISAIIVAVMIFVYNMLDPKDKASTIRRLATIRARLVSGSISTAEVTSILQCAAKTNEATAGLFKAVAATVLLMVAISFIAIGDRDISNYRERLQAVDDCAV